MPQDHIKMEPLGPSFSLIYPSTTPSAACSKRLRPYPPLSREHVKEFAIMSNSPAYVSWSSNGRPHHPVERKPSDGDKSPAYPAPPQFINGPYIPTLPSSSGLGSISSSSSLTGAMGESTIHPRRSLPPNSSGGRRSAYPNPQTHSVMWAGNNAQPIQNMNTSTYSTVPEHGSLSFADMSSSLMTMDNYTTDRNNSSPASLPHSPIYQGHPVHYGQPSSNNGMTHQTVSPYLSPSPSDDQTDEIHRLRRRVRELEIECSRSRSIIDSLGHPSPSPAFQASWKARTEARKQIFCAPNRAGNRLCSWHDSRRERRTYAPRQAPPGYLNCGCSEEEALFEETLSRNHVGSYHPGETVRMDPALRNPLLKLLEKRYGYKDGDFERDPVMERWADGESPSAWEQKAQAGPALRRRTDDRH